MSRALETERLFLILPALQGISGKIQYSYRGRVQRASIQKQYASAQESPLTVQEIKDLLIAHGILDDLLAGDRKTDQLGRHQSHLRLVNEGRVGLGIN